MKKLITLIFIVLLIGCKTNVTNDTNRLDLNIDEAKNIALSHSFVKKDEAEFVVEEIIDGDNPYFLLAYSSNDKNYLYQIDKQNGKILISSDQETPDSIERERNRIIERKQNCMENMPCYRSESKDHGHMMMEHHRHMRNIDKSVAYNLALKDVGVYESEVSKLEISEKTKNNYQVLKVEFDYLDYSYEYYIRKSDGFIIKKEIEFEGKLFDNNEISMTQAKELALSSVSGATDNHIKIKEDLDDGRLVFEGEIIFDSYEYEFEIDAKSAIFLEWSAEYLY